LLRVYTDEEQTFTQLKIDLLKAVAAQAAAAIENTRLITESIEAEALEKQVAMAAEVQQRMIPQTPPKVPGLDLAAVYVPAYTLGGDFYDFISLPGDKRRARDRGRQRQGRAREFDHVRRRAHSARRWTTSTTSTRCCGG